MPCVARDARGSARSRCAPFPALPAGQRRADHDRGEKCGLTARRRLRQSIRQPGAGSLLLGWLRSPGVLSATPVLVFFLIGFVGPLVIVLAFSFTPERTFDLGAGFTTENYERIFTESYYISFIWSFALAGVTVACNLLIGYPIAYGLTKLFGPLGGAGHAGARHSPLRLRERAGSSAGISS